MSKRMTIVSTILLTLGAAVALLGLLVNTRAMEPYLMTAGIPTLISYQGTLADDMGQPISGTVQLQFGLFDAATGGTALWQETQSNVPVNNGFFTVYLGSVTPLSAAHFSGAARYIEVQVDSGDGFVTLPRQQFTAVPYALQAQEAAVAPWTGLTGVPAGFADGVDDDTQYTAGTGLTLDGTEFNLQNSAYENVVVVAKSGGDFTTVQAAIDSIVDASATNPFLVWVAPGVYTETVTMQPHIHLQGAGQEATIIRSTVTNPSSPPVVGTLNLTTATSLRDLTISNSGSGNVNVAILGTGSISETQMTDVNAASNGVGGIFNFGIYLYDNAVNVTLDTVHSIGENATNNNYGLMLYQGAAAIVHGGSYSADSHSSGLNSIGIYSSGNLEAYGVIANGEDGTSLNNGIRTSGSGIHRLYGGAFNAKGGADATGIHNFGQLETEGASATGADGTTNRGLQNESGTAVLHGGSFTGQGGDATDGIHNSAVLTASHVTASGLLATEDNHGLTNAGTAVVSHSSFYGQDGGNTYALNNTGSSADLQANAVVARAEGASSRNRGFYNTDGATAVMHGGTVEAHGGSYAYGIDNTDNSNSGTTLFADDVTVLATEASNDNFAVFHIGFPSTTITRATLEGDDLSVINAGGPGPVEISNSRFITPSPGPGQTWQGTMTCTAVSRSTVFAGSGCP